MLVHLYDLEGPALRADGLTGRGDVSEMAEQEAGQGLIRTLALRHDEARFLEQLLPVRPARQEAGLARRLRPSPAFVDPADDLFQQVLIRDDAPEPSVLADPLCEMDGLR